MTNSALQDREAEDLPTHVVACSERYKTLFHRLNRIERIQLVVAGKVLLILLAVIGYLINLAMRGSP